MRVVLAGPHLLCDLLASTLETPEIGVDDDFAETPKTVPVRLRALRERDERSGVEVPTAVLLADPSTPAWVDAVREVPTEYPRIGLIVLLARPSYLAQRLWLKRPWPERPGVPLANGIVTLASLTGDMVDAVLLAAARPGREAGYGLDAEARHPFGLARRDEEGKAALRIRQNKAERHRLLVLTSRGVEPKRMLSAVHPNSAVHDVFWVSGGVRATL